MKQSPVLTRTEVQYRRPLTIFDEPVERISISELGKVRWKVSFEIVNAKTIHCSGQQAGYFYDLVARKTAPLPKELKARYQAALSKS